ncbi:ANTAR domain-containing protein [Streptomyces sp. NPDC005409]|uniref:ANTAR domain-containing protein n=1 Tax=Streptomyces sp. NPDC005409 TaxID=3155342 RepID=UPI003454084F
MVRASSAAAARIAFASRAEHGVAAISITQAALAGKAVFDTASGILAATADITPSEGAHHLCTYSRRHHLRPTDVADQLVRRTLAPHTVLAP